MTKNEIQNYLGSDYIVKKVIEDDNELFAFYVSRKFEESGGNDRYSLIGVGPFYLNKKTSEKRLLGSVEFHEKYIERQIIQENLKNENTELNLEQVISVIKERKHINGDEFEIIMNELNIDLQRISISSTDFINEIIESPEPNDIIKFRKVFEKAELEFIQESPNKIIVKNE